MPRGLREDREAQLYRKASLIAACAMGYARENGPRSSELVADEDPLAWWCAVENIVDLAKWYRDPSKHEKGTGNV